MGVLFPGAACLLGPRTDPADVQVLTGIGVRAVFGLDWTGVGVGAVFGL